LRTNSFSITIEVLNLKEIFIERRKEILRVAIKNSGSLSDCFIEEERHAPYPGQIYKAVVKNIIPALKSAFLDIGLEKNAYLYLEGKFEKRNIKKGQELIVEVVKEELGQKGAKVTSAFSIPGRYCVLLTDNCSISFSSKISSQEYIKEIREGIKKPSDIGIKIRTAAEQVSLDEINQEIDKLYRQYKRIIEESSYKIKPGLLYNGGGTIGKVLRDNLDGLVSKIIVDSKEDFEAIKEYVIDKKDISTEVQLYEGHRSLFDFYGIEKEISHLKNERVNLSCGGYIVIQNTEAMYVIDVNSGKNVGSNLRELTALETNLEAAKTCARQIRLRNLSGIILIDFIDMQKESHKNKVLEELHKGFEDDKNKTIIYPFTQLGLVQIARRRKALPIENYILEECKQCKGHGRKLKFSYVCMLIKNEMLRVDNDSKIKDILIMLNSYYRRFVEESSQGFLNSIEAEGKRIYLKFIDGEFENFKVEPMIFKKQIEEVQKYLIN